MNRGSALLSVMALFLSGVAIGALGMRLYVERYPPPQTIPGVGLERGAQTPAWRELDLTPQQRRQFREILQESRSRARAVREEVRPQVVGLVEETLLQLRDVLREDQRSEFDALRRRHGRRFERALLGEQRRGRRP